MTDGLFSFTRIVHVHTRCAWDVVLVYYVRKGLSDRDTLLSTLARHRGSAANPQLGSLKESEVVVRRQASQTLIETHA